MCDINHESKSNENKFREKIIRKINHSHYKGDCNKIAIGVFWIK
jgi:hypothetical protein